MYWHSALYSLALAAVFIFEPIYLYSLGYSLTEILWFYVEVYVFYALFIFPGARFASRFGYKHAILLSNIFYVCYWALLFFTRSHPALFFIAPVFFALQKSWFWPAYDADVALCSIKAQRGREMGLLYSLVQLSFVVAPFFGGFISDRFGLSAVFVFATVLIFFSVYPLLRTPEIYPRHRFSFRNFRSMVRQYPKNFFGYWGYAEDLIIRSLWPIYIFLVVPDLFNVGVISTIATAAGTVLMLYVGKLTDRLDKRKLIRWGAVFYAPVWFFTFLGRSLGSVLSLDALLRAGKDIVSVPMSALTFERAGNKSADHAIAYSVFYEFSLSIGKIVTALLGIAILTMGGGIFLVFAVTGALTLFYVLLK